MKYYEIIFKSGKAKDTLVLKANSKSEAFELAKNQVSGQILKITEVSKPVEFNKIFAYFKENILEQKSSVNQMKFIFSIRQISVMANAGIPFTDILREAAKGTDDKVLKEIFTKALFDVNSGLSFSESLKKYEKQVGKISVIMASLGEKTGTMAEAMNSLATMLEESLQNKQNIKKAIRYPLITLFTMAVAFIVLIVFVVPKFKAIFDRFQTALPLPTKILLGIEYVVTNYAIFIIAFILFFIFAFKYFYNKNKEFALKIDEYVLKIKIVGAIINYASLFRFSLVFSELSKAGLPVVEAINVASEGVENSYLSSKLDTLSFNIKKGLSLSSAFVEAGVFESMIIQIVAAGEASGTLSGMLSKATDYYRAQFQMRMDTISSSLEPILIAIMSTAVLLLALGIFMPMWELAGAINK